MPEKTLEANVGIAIHTFLISETHEMEYVRTEGKRRRPYMEGLELLSKTLIAHVRDYDKKQTHG